MSNQQETPFRKAAVERLASPDQLDRLVTIADRRAWLALAGLALLLLCTLAWGIFGSVETAIPARGIVVAGQPHAAALQAVIYIPTESGKRVQAGMSVRLTPAMLKKEAGAIVRGTVTQVDDFPATHAAMLAELQSDILADALAAAGAPYAARIAIDPADAAVPLSAGTTVDAVIVLRRQRPIALILPFLGKAAGSD